MNRFYATGYHFIISMLIGVILLGMCWYIWYPAPMLMAIGGHEIFMLVIGIDVVLGPLLTLIVFKSGKKSLKLDLFVIGVLQVSAMIYGVSTLLEARPVYIAALGDKFQVVQASELTNANLAKAKTSLPWWGPILVGTKAPIVRAEIDALNDVNTVGGGRGHFPHLHISYENMSSEILSKANDISVLKKNNPNKVKEIQTWLDEHGVKDTSVKFQSIKIQASVFPIIIDATSAKIIGIIPLPLSL